MAIFRLHITLISAGILLAFGLAARWVARAVDGGAGSNLPPALIALAVGVSLCIYLWFFVRRGWGGRREENDR